MKKLIAAIFLVVSITAIAQVVLDQSNVTRTRTRDLTDVSIIFNPDNTISIRGTVGVTIRTGAISISQRNLATITLSGADLTAALSSASLPNQTVIRDRFVALFQSAWTNRLGVIVVNGSEAE